MEIMVAHSAHRTIYEPIFTHISENLCVRSIIGKRLRV